MSTGRVRSWINKWCPPEKLGVGSIHEYKTRWRNCSIEGRNIDKFHPIWSRSLIGNRPFEHKYRQCLPPVCQYTGKKVYMLCYGQTRAWTKWEHFKLFYRARIWGCSGYPRCCWTWSLPIRSLFRRHYNSWRCSPVLYRQIDTIWAAAPDKRPIAGSMLKQYRTAVEANRLDDALVFGLEHFAKASLDEIELIRSSPQWSRQVSLTPTWVRELIAIDNLGPSLDRYKNLNMPVLLLVGTKSKEYPLRATSEALSTILPHASLEHLQGHGHTAHLTAPQMLADVVTNFLVERPD